jgi:uncharacterized integral membrane protein
MKTKTIFWIIILILAVIFAFQNTENVKLTVYFWKFNSPLIIVILVSIIIGLLSGIYIRGIKREVKEKIEKKEEKVKEELKPKKRKPGIKKEEK